MSAQNQERVNLIINLTKQLLDAIANADWKTYTELCDEKLTCFEPEAAGTCVEGLPFHKFYFDFKVNRDALQAKSGDSSSVVRMPQQTTIAETHVHLLGSGAVISYIRLIQKVDSKTGAPVTKKSLETRVWSEVNNKWKMVHFHRSEDN